MMANIDYTELPWDVLSMLSKADGGRCPECHWDQPGSHHSNCELANAMEPIAVFMLHYESYPEKGENS